MDFTILIAFWAVFAIGSVGYALSNSERRSKLLKRLRYSRRRSSEARTPPCDLTPEKERVDPFETADYRDTLPPSRRFALKDAAPELFRDLEDISDEQLESEEKKRAIPLDVPFDEIDGNALSPTGISVEEIKMVGDFPDYATLSGVPLPQPYKEFDISKAIPRPYRPFRWAYHQTMSLTKLEPDWWLELENTYADRIKQRQGLFAKYGDAVLQMLPGSEHACKELMEMCLQFLYARYPQYFDLDTEAMLFHNQILGTTSNLKETPPLEVIVNNIPEDFALMLRDPASGFYRFRAGVICSALGWNLGTKIGMRLHEIHEPIPDYKEKMRFSMDRYFAKKPTDRAIQRGSWGLEIDQPLFMPPGDPHEKHREVQHADLPLSRCNLRVDWQTLRRLPLSGAVVFNFKALFTPVTEFREEPFVPSIILKVLKEGKKSIMEYKNTWHTEHVVVPALEEYEREQVDKGVIPREWDVHTLEESPFFPGWEERWHRHQGF